MWPFRTKHVVHVEIRRNVNAAGALLAPPYVGTYQFIGDPIDSPRTVPFKPGLFAFASQVKQAVKRDLPSHMNKRQKRRTVVKMWLDDSIRGTSQGERWITGPIVIVALLELLALIGIGLIGIFIDTKEAEPFIPGTAIAAVAANAAYFFGNLSTRHLKLAERFEYRIGKVLATYGVLVLSISANVAVLSGWPDAWFPDQVDYAKRMATVLAAFGLIVASLGSFASGAIDVLKWALIEEVQRRSKSARVIADLVEQRKRVRA